MKVLDSLRSLVSGLGTDKDKTTSMSFGFRIINYAELSAMHRSDWLSRKVVDIIPNDMTREWRDWQAEDDQIEKIEEVESIFNVQPKINKALQTARLYGGSAIIMGIKGQDPSQELRLDSVKAGMLEYLHVLTNAEVKASELIRDVTSPYFGEPTWYEVNSANGLQARIHPSRVVRLVGAIILDNQVADSFSWGDSVLQIVYDAIQNATSAQQHIAGLIPEAKTDVIYIPGLSNYAETLKGQTALTNRFSYANVAKSMFNMLLLDGTGQSGEGQGEKWEQKQINFAQLPELMQQYLKVASGAADIPLIRLLQDAPSGLGSNGDSAFKAYYDNIAARQRTELTPALNRLDEVIIRSALGNRPPEIWYDWAPLWTMSEKESAEIFKLKADAARALVGSSAGEIIPIEAVSDALVNRLVEDGDLPGLEAAIEEYGKLSEQEDDDEQLLAAATSRGLIAPARPAMERAAANDATPRSLYVRRDVLNRAEIQRWAKAQGLTAVDDMHVTIMYSTAAVDWMKIRPSYTEKVEIIGGPRVIEKLGPPDSPVVALLIPLVGDLRWRHEEMKEEGAEPNWPEYVPHITIQKGDADIDKLEPYQGRILLGPEIFEEVRVGDSAPFFFDALADKKKKSQTGEGNPGFDPSQPRGSNGQWINTGAGDPVKAAAAKAASTSKYSAEKVQGLTSKNPKELSHYEKKVLAKYKKELSVKKAEAEAKYNAEKASQSAAQAQNTPAPSQTPPSPTPAPQPTQTAAYGTPASNAAKSVATSKYSSEKVQGLANKDPKTLSQYEKKVLAKYKTALKAELGKTVNTPASGAAAPQQSKTTQKQSKTTQMHDPESPSSNQMFGAIGKKYHGMKAETVKNLATGKWQPDPNKGYQVKAAQEGKEWLATGKNPMAAPTPLHAYTPSKSEQIKASLLADPPPVTSYQTAQSNYAKQTDLLTASERNAVRSYTGSSYQHINGSLRTPGYVPSSTVLAIDRAIAKSVASQEIVLVRGVKSINGLISGGKPAVGAIMHDKGFMSTTRQVGTAASFSGGGYGMKIRVPAGRNVLPVRDISSHQSEDEFLLPRGSSFRVVSVNEASNTITVDLI